MTPAKNTVTNNFTLTGESVRIHIQLISLSSIGLYLIFWAVLYRVCTKGFFKITGDFRVDLIGHE